MNGVAAAGATIAALCDVDEKRGGEPLLWDAKNLKATNEPSANSYQPKIVSNSSCLESQ